MLGICFGHQIIAAALGGTVARSDRGWGVGRHSYRTENWPQYLGPGPEYLALLASHRDQVTELPDRAVVLAGSDFCGFAGLWYPGFALTVQGHPEFTRAYAKDLLNSRRGTTVPADVADVALHSIEDHNDGEEFARIVMRFATAD